LGEHSVVLKRLDHAGLFRKRVLDLLIIFVTDEGLSHSRSISIVPPRFKAFWLVLWLDRLQGSCFCCFL